MFITGSIIFHSCTLEGVESQDGDESDIVVNQGIDSTDRQTEEDVLMLSDTIDGGTQCNGLSKRRWIKSRMGHQEN